MSLSRPAAGGESCRAGFFLNRYGPLSERGDDSAVPAVQKLLQHLVVLGSQRGIGKNDLVHQHDHGEGDKAEKNADAGSDEPGSSLPGKMAVVLHSGDEGQRRAGHAQRKLDQG